MDDYNDDDDTAAASSAAAAATIGGGPGIDIHHPSCAVGGGSAEANNAKKIIVENLEGVKSSSSTGGGSSGGVVGPISKMNDTTDRMTDDENIAEDDVDDHDDDEGDNSDPTLTEVQKAERAVMLDLIMGNNRKKSTVIVPPVGVSSLPSKSQNLKSSSSVLPTKKDPVQQKIEELMRQSLENIKKGTHPLQVKTNNGGDDDDDDDTPISVWNDDMAVDPSVYHNNYAVHNRRAIDGSGRDISQGSSTGSMMTDDDGGGDVNNGATSQATLSTVFPVPFRQRKRSNSISNATMDIENDDTNFGNPFHLSSGPVGGGGGRGGVPFTSSNTTRLSSTSDMEMET